MKKVGLFFCLTLLLAFAGCSDDDPQTPVAPAAVATPELALSRNTSTSFGVVWEAVEHAATYAYTLSEEGGATLHDDRTTQTELSFDGLTPATAYVLRVQALSGDEAFADSQPAEILVYTPAAGEEALLLSLTVGEIGFDRAKLEVTTNREGVSYYYAVVPATKIAQKSDREIIELLKPQITAEALATASVSETVADLNPETTYVALAFGYDAERGGSTSGVFRSEPFITEVDERPTIDISLAARTTSTLTGSFVPSDKRMMYITSCIPCEELDKTTNSAALAEVVKTVNGLIALYGWETVEQMVLTGDAKATVTDVEPGVDYYLLAFGIERQADDTIAAITRLYQSDAVRPESPEAKVLVDVMIENGDDRGPEYAGLVGVFFFYTPNGATTHYYAGQFNELVNDVSDEEVIEALMKGGAGELDPESGYGSFFEPGEEAICCVVGVNSLGEPGPLTRFPWKADLDFKKVVRGDAGLKFSYKVTNGIDGTFEGYPAITYTFEPQGSCTDYRFVYGALLPKGYFDQTLEGDENALIEEFFNMNTNRYIEDSEYFGWMERKELEEDQCVTVFNSSVWGATGEVWYTSLDANGAFGQTGVFEITVPKQSEVGAEGTTQVLSLRPLSASAVRLSSVLPATRFDAAPLRKAGRLSPEPIRIRDVREFR